MIHWHAFQAALRHLDKPAFHASMILAGILPAGFFPYLFDHNVAGTIYFMLLMPGAVLSFVVSVVRIRRELRRWFGRGLE